jgi:homoserine O-acetyltransferase
VPDLRLHYTTLGTPQRDGSGHITNAVLLLHGTTGTGRNFLGAATREALFDPGKPLDAGRYYLVMPDGIGAGGSSKPSDGLHGRFPHFGTLDQVEAQYRLLAEGLGIQHLVLVLGTSLGGMQTWIWGERHPDMMDGLVTIAASPAPIAGRNMLWRQTIIDAIRNDPDWRGGRYSVEPTQWRHILPLFTIMTGSAIRLEDEAPTRTEAVALEAKLVEAGRAIHPDDFLFAFESSEDYDPVPDLGKIRAPLLAINFGDDLLNPPELGIVSSAMKKIAHGTAILIPGSAATYGHETLAHPDVWVKNLVYFLRSLPSMDR